MKIFQKLKYRIFLFHKKILEQESSLLVKPILAILWFLSIFWCVVALLRRHLKPFKVPAIVISVGNIVSGGVGKTPLVIKLIKDLSDFQKQIGVISRGYGASQKTIPVQISKATNWKLIGDEPKCIINACQKISLFIGKDRKKSAVNAIEKGKKILILDDGLQQKKLDCDFQIIVLNSCDLFGGGYFLPRGSLREHPNTLKLADLIVINHCKTKNEYEKAKLRLRKFSSSEIVGSNFVFSEASNSKGEKISLDEQKVGIFCSIASPKNFVKQIDELNCKIINYKFYSDHEDISERSLLSFDSSCFFKGARYLVCTEKDFVKVHNFKTKLPIIVLKINLNICFEKLNWDNLIEKILVNMNNTSVISKEKINEKLV